MNLLERIDQDIKKAMLAREKEKLEALRAVKNALLVQRTEKGAGSIIDEEAEIKILKRLVKQRKEAAELYVQQNRKDLAEVEEAQADVISGYLPEQLSEEDIRQVVKGLIEQLGARDMKDMGKVMGAASKELAGKADNKLVSAIVKELLS
ncbi:MAG: GatB/YqeY domain-containing protein [Bacteroidetes bacterium]|nr:MAG: GatB/YqeY domain-containing protein [Bacteroidota bacterium]